MPWSFNKYQHLTIKEAAAILGWQERRVRNYLYKGKLKQTAHGRKVTMVSRHSVLKLLEEIKNG